MMKLIFLGLLALAAAKPKGELSFSLIDERSIDGIPSVKVNFADGSSDFLVLSQYEGLDGHFIGHLANEKTACVAMVNHPEHAELTIMSNRVIGSTMYKWHNNGNVELIPEVFNNGKEQSVAVDKDEDENDEPAANQADDDELQNIENNMTADEAATVPTTAKLQVKVGYDDSFLAKLGSKAAVEAYWNAAAPHLQARYCHSSLGTKIKVERIGDFKHHAGKTLTASGDSLKQMQADTVANLGTADLYVYMVHDASSQWGTAGIAYRSVVCGHYPYKKYQQSINEWRKQGSVAYGALVAHEIGHNLGMYHDFDKYHGGKKNSCNSGNSGNHVMSYGELQAMEKWSTCSKKDFEAHFLWVKSKSYLTWCMEADIGNVCGAGGNSPSPPPPSACTGTCKNSKWKGDKYCDDGNNNCGCGWDGGDCCGKKVKKDYCNECKCLDPKA